MMGRSDPSYITREDRMKIIREILRIAQLITAAGGGKIPHANREGYWEHTTYWVQDCGRDVKEKYSLKDAKEWAEEYREEQAWQRA